jgi:catechol 2,3-dioxygenase-like lactoylglutathione lyase family enzyme
LLHRGFINSEELPMLGKSRLQTVIWTSRITEAEQFYTSLLGLGFRGKSDDALVYEVSGSNLRVSPVPSTQPTAHTVLGFAVDDFDATVTELGKRGINWERFQGFPHDERGIVITPDGSRVVWFRDPDGNLLSIVEFSPRLARRP